MQISPPVETFLAQPEMALMSLFGRMRSFTEGAGFSDTLPIVWQCSDESQSIKKSLFGYVYDCPVFNLGRVGAPLGTRTQDPPAMTRETGGAPGSPSIRRLFTTTSGWTPGSRRRCTVWPEATCGTG